MIFSIAMGAEYLFYMKSIETHARAFLALIILGIGTVDNVEQTFRGPFMNREKRRPRSSTSDLI